MFSLQVSSAGMTISLLLVSMSFYLKVSLRTLLAHLWINKLNESYMSLSLCVLLIRSFIFFFLMQNFVTEGSVLHTILAITAVLGVVVCIW